MSETEQKILDFFEKRMSGDNEPLFPVAVAGLLGLPIEETRVALMRLEQEGLIGQSVTDKNPPTYAMVVSPAEMRAIWERDQSPDPAPQAVSEEAFVFMVGDKVRDKKGKFGVMTIYSATTDGKYGVSYEDNSTSEYNSWDGKDLVLEYRPSWNKTTNEPETVIPDVLKEKDERIAELEAELENVGKELSESDAWRDSERAYIVELEQERKNLKAENARKQAKLDEIRVLARDEQWSNVTAQLNIIWRIAGGDKFLQQPAPERQAESVTLTDVKKDDIA